jgi:Mg2+-importing ATPase
MSFFNPFEHYHHHLAPPPKLKAIPEKAALPKPDAALLEMGQTELKTLLVNLKSTPEGLNVGESQNRLREQGPNEVVHEKPDPWYKQLFRNFKTPFTLLLMCLSVISFVTRDTAGGTVIAVIALVSVALGFFQEYRSSQAAEKLKAMVTNTATVLRPKEPASSEQLEEPIQNLVPGDVIHLAAGDMVPADVRLITCKDIFVSQAALTGESLPAEKSAVPSATPGVNPLEIPTLCFMGSNVLSGAATAVVLRTGAQTYLGSVAKAVVGQRVLTSFETGVNRFTVLMLRFMMVMVPLVFLINGFLKHNWFEAFMFAVAVAVGLTPEMLPMIVTVNLAKGALMMSRKKVIVKRLNSIQNFGAMDVLCTDKTGTLTQNKVALLKYVDSDSFKCDRTLKYAYLNSFFQTGLKNLLDVAVLAQADLEQKFKVEGNYKKVDEIPFDFTRRRMSVVVEEEGKKDILICKGALEEIFAVSGQVEVDGDLAPLDEDMRKDLRAITEDLNQDGLRVLAVAYKEGPPGRTDYTVKDETGLILLGYLAFLDPPKETTKEAITLLKNRGIAVKILTGDNATVTKSVCEKVGIDSEKILTGDQIQAMTDDQLAEATETCFVYAKLSPSQKELIVKAMHRKNHVVGFLGDGINDAPALRTSDVGISGDNAVDIAKESADIILLEQSLLVLADGVLEGRRVFGNIIKYIKMGASSNFGNTFSVLGSSIILPFLPMMPVQILIQNLLYDLSQTAIPLDRVDEEYLAKPRKWEIGYIARFMLFIGPISSIFDYSTFALMWFVFGANSPDKQSLFQTGWFVEGLLSQTLIVHLIRTSKIPFLQSWAAPALVMTTAGVMLIGLYFPFSPLAPKIGMVPLPPAYFGYLFLTLLSYWALTQVVKSWFIKKYGMQ